MRDVAMVVNSYPKASKLRQIELSELTRTYKHVILDLKLPEMRTCYNSTYQ